MRYATSKCKIIETESEYVVKGEDIFTGREVEVRIPAPAFQKYHQGTLMQDAMPMLSTHEREFLLSGVYDWDLPKGW